MTFIEIIYNSKLRKYFNKQVERQKQRLKIYFRRKKELPRKKECLEELNALLDMEHKDKEIVDGEPDVSDLCERKDRDAVR